MNELVTANRDRDVRRAGLGRREEDQVARFQILRPHRFSQSILIAHGTGQRHAVLCEHVLCEAAAIEAGGIAPAVAIRRAAQCQRAARQRKAGRPNGAAFLSSVSRDTERRPPSSQPSYLRFAFDDKDL